MGSQVNEKRETERQVFFFFTKLTMQNIDGFLLRKHCKEGATVVTQFWTHNFLECYFIFIIYKNRKKLRKI